MPEEFEIIYYKYNDRHEDFILHVRNTNIGNQLTIRVDAHVLNDLIHDVLSIDNEKNK